MGSWRAAGVVCTAAWACCCLDWMLSYQDSDLSEVAVAVSAASLVSAAVLWWIYVRKTDLWSIPPPTLDDDNASLDREADHEREPELDLAWCTTEMSKCAHSGDVKMAKQWMDQIEKGGFEVDRAVYTCMITACARAKRPNEAAKWLELMETNGITPDTMAYTALIQAFANVGASMKAEEVLLRMHNAGLKPTSQTFEIVLNAYVHDTNKSSVAVPRMINLMNKVGVPPSVVMFNTLINESAERAAVDEALRWLQIMCASTVTPNGITYNTVLKACAKGGDMQSAEYVYAQMKISGIVCDSATYNALINACARAKSPSAAVKWLRTMQNADIGATLHSYTNVILAFAEAGAPEEACKWLQAAISDGITPDKFIYTAVLKAYAMQGDVAQANQVLNNMIAVGIAPDVVTYTILVDAYANARQPASAMHCCGLMRERGHGHPTILTFASLMKGYALVGDLLQVEKLQQTMTDAKLRGNTHTYFQLLQACYRANKPERGTFWFENMKAEGLSPNKQILDAMSRLATRRKGRHHAERRDHRSADRNTHLVVNNDGGWRQVKSQRGPKHRKLEVS